MKETERERGRDRDRESKKNRETETEQQKKMRDRETVTERQRNRKRDTERERENNLAFVNIISSHTPKSKDPLPPSGPLVGLPVLPMLPSPWRDRGPVSGESVPPSTRWRSCRKHGAGPSRERRPWPAAGGGRASGNRRGRLLGARRLWGESSEHHPETQECAPPRHRGKGGSSAAGRAPGEATAEAGPGRQR